jgi:hypothetical protein
MVIAESGQKAREIRGGLRRGGERRPPYGPALGGEAGAVLIMKLIRKGDWGRPPSVVSTTPWRNTRSCPHAASANRITTYAAPAEKVYEQIATR